MKPNNYGLFSEKFKNVFFVVASNFLPNHANKLNYPDLHRDVWLPMMTRVKRVELNQGHEGGVFPYEAVHLAGALEALAAQRAERILAEAAGYLDSNESA